MVSETRTAGPPLPPRPLPRPSLPPHSARPIGHPRKFPGTQGMVADRLAGIMKNASACQNATCTIKSTKGRESSARNKENCAIPLETAVELLGIKKEEEESAQGVKEYRVGEACIERPKHPLPKTPTRIGEINEAQLLRGGILDIENQQSEPLGLMIASTVHGSWDISANDLIGLHALQSLPLCSGRTYNTVTRIRSGKYRGDAPCESHPLPALPAQKKTKPTPDDVGYVINSNTEYLEAVAKQYSQSFGKMGKVFIKVHGIDGLNLPKKCTGMHHEGIAADQYVYIVLECDGQNFSSKRVAAEPGRIRVGEEFAFSVRAGCNLTVKLAVASPTKGMITGPTSFYPTVGTNQQLDSKASGEFSSSSSTQNLSSEIGSSGYSIPRMESSGSSNFSTGESVAQICLQLDESALSHLSIPKSTAGFQQSWDLLGKYIVPQEHVKPSSYERKATSHSLKRQWQKLKKHSVMSGSTGVGTLNDMADDASVSQSHLVVVGNIKVSVVVWPYSGDWTPSGFDECVRILTCDGVLNLNHLIKGWTEHGNEYIARNPNVKLTSILEAGSVLGNMMVLGNASVRVAGSLFWKRRSFAIHPPHLLSLPISDQLPTHVHQAFDLRLCRVEAPFDTPIQDIQDGLWHPTANAFRICFRKSVMNFKEEETVELSVDRLTTAKEWVNILREIVGRLQSMEF